jgi:RNA polymerase sigma-70 factor (ECF subfamily)
VNSPAARPRGGPEHGSAGDRVEQLYRDHGTRIFGYLARRTSNADEAADLMSDVMVAVLRSQARIPEPPNDLPWLYGVARNVRRNASRAGQRRQAATRRLADSLRQHVPESAVVSELAQDVRRELARLPEIDREIITLSAWEGMSSVEIGQALGLRPGSVRSRLHRARRQLAAALDADQGSVAKPLVPPGTAHGDPAAAVLPRMAAAQAFAGPERQLGVFSPSVMTEKALEL